MLHSDPHLSGSEKKQMAVEVTKLLYIVVVDDDEESNSFRYTRSVLQSSLQLMGCKPRHAFKISQRVFERIRSECLGDTLPLENKDKSEAEIYIESGLKKADAGNILIPEGDKSKSKLFEMYKRRTTVVIRRKTFLDVACDALTEYKYVGPNQRADLILSCRIRERKESVTVLLCGTSGCGKSTLSALLASRLGITTVISTDSVRHMMRSFVDEKQNPLLWASTYHAGEYLDPVAVAEAKAKRKAKKLAGSGPHDKSDVSGTGKPPLEGGGSGSNGGNVVEVIGRKQMAIEGFKAQSEMVIDSLDRLITAWEERKESVVVEGVHLSLNFVMGLMKKHPSIIPFMVYISNEEKHLERFAVRAKYMTLDPARNKYVKYIRNIRTIQEYLCNRAVKHLVPKINNTNVDRSVASIHATVFSSLRRRSKGENLYDPTTNTVMLVDEEYRNQCDANNLSSKGMFQLIQRKGSSRHLMALLNKDGTVKKAWPVDSGDTMGGGGGYVYGPVSIGRSESVNLQFGNFGISAWANDTGGTSHASSVDESRQGDVSDNGSKYYSSCCSSPKNSESLSKERKEEQSVHGSDEDVDDDPPEGETDEDLSDDDKEQNHDEMEGSVDEGSTKSDEEYDDLAMQDNGYLCDDDEEYYKFNDDDNNIIKISNEEKYKRNLDLFLKNKSTAPSRTCSNVLGEKKMLHGSGSVKLRKRSQSISALKHEKLINNNSPRQSAVL